MGSNVPRQDVFFYKSKWTAEVDSLLLSIIVDTKNKAQWEGTIIPIEILEQVSGVVTAEVGTMFTWRDLYERFQFFEQRYRTFKSVLDTNGVSWNVNTNTVNAASPVWKNIFKKKNKLAAAYFYSGDPEFPRLAQLFGPQSVKKEGRPDVVLISDTTVSLDERTLALPPPGNPAATVTEGSDSICSP